jgi:hypothetical protein
MTLSYSRHLFCYPVLRMTQPEFLAAHVAAFAFFDGCPARLVPDYVPRHIMGGHRAEVVVRLLTRPYPQRASREDESRGTSFLKKLLAWPLAAFVVVFRVFGTIVVFLVIIGLVVLAGWLLMTLT